MADLQSVLSQSLPNCTDHAPTPVDFLVNEEDVKTRKAGTVRQLPENSTLLYENTATRWIQLRRRLRSPTRGKGCLSHLLSGIVRLFLVEVKSNFFHPSEANCHYINRRTQR
jgi:hypothetical protein